MSFLERKRDELESQIEAIEKKLEVLKLRRDAAHRCMFRGLTEWQEKACWMGLLQATATVEKS